jgi:hypothetical protein
LVKNGFIKKSKGANRDDMDRTYFHSTYEGLDSVNSALIRYHFSFLIFLDRNIPFGV